MKQRKHKPGKRFMYKHLNIHGQVLLYHFDLPVGRKGRKKIRDRKGNH